jgi:hypothetical protein
MKTVIVITQNKLGRSKMKNFKNESILIFYLLKIREEGIIKCDNKIIGKIWKNDDNKWNYFYNQDKIL